MTAIMIAAVALYVAVGLWLAAYAMVQTAERRAMLGSAWYGAVLLGLVVVAGPIALALAGLWATVGRRRSTNGRQA